MAPSGSAAVCATGSEVDEVVEDGARAGASVGLAVVLGIGGVVAGVAGLMAVVVVTGCGGAASDGAREGADGDAVLGVVEVSFLVVDVVVGLDVVVVSGDWVVVCCACGVMVIAAPGATFTTAVMEG